MGAFSHLKLQISLFYFYPPFVYVEFFFLVFFILENTVNKKLFFPRVNEIQSQKIKKCFPECYIDQ